MRDNLLWVIPIQPMKFCFSQEHRSCRECNPLLQGGRNTPNPTRAQKKKKKEKLGHSLVELKCKKIPATEESAKLWCLGRNPLVSAQTHKGSEDGLTGVRLLTLQAMAQGCVCARRSCVVHHPGCMLAFLRLSRPESPC